MAKAKAKSTKAKAAEEEVELEELEDDSEEAEEETPADEIWGVRNGLIPLLKEKTGKDYTPREVRTLLRKMAREDNARIDREIVAGNKSRYEWDGPSDPEVKAILKAVKAGEVEQGKKEALDKLKADKADKAASGAKKGKKGKKGKAAKAAPPVDDDDDDDLEELEDDD